MNKSESIKELAGALVKAQADFPAIPRNREVTVKSDRGSYKFRYAPFEDILRAVKPVLSKHGLSYSQGEHEGVLETLLMHNSGEWISHGTKINLASASAQAYGSALTYARRYGFCAALGIQADDDDDANAADGNHIEQQSEFRGSAKPAHSGAEMKKNAFEDMSEDEKKFLHQIAADVAALVTEDRDDDAYGFIKAKRLEMEEELALSHILGKEVCARLKKAGERARMEERAAERNKHQQFRPEPRPV